MNLYLRNNWWYKNFIGRLESTLHYIYRFTYFRYIFSFNCTLSLSTNKIIDLSTSLVNDCKIKTTNTKKSKWLQNWILYKKYKEFTKKINNFFESEPEIEVQEDFQNKRLSLEKKIIWAKLFRRCRKYQFFPAI